MVHSVPRQRSPHWPPQLAWHCDPAPGRRGPLVVVGGLPGAGKTTALRDLGRAPDTPEVALLDSSDMCHALRRRLPRVPYGVYRPLVHSAHWLRIAAVALTARVPVVVHENATRPAARWALRLLARLGRRPVRMVWLDVPEETARAGQLSRGRVVRSQSFRRHVRRVRHAHPAVAAGATWDEVDLADRQGVVRAIARACACQEQEQELAVPSAEAGKPRATAVAPSFLR